MKKIKIKLTEAKRRGRRANVNRELITPPDDVLERVRKRRKITPQERGINFPSGWVELNEFWRVYVMSGTPSPYGDFTVSEVQVRLVTDDGSIDRWIPIDVRALRQNELKVFYEMVQEKIDEFTEKLSIKWEDYYNDND